MPRDQKYVIVSGSSFTRGQKKESITWVMEDGKRGPKFHEHCGFSTQPQSSITSSSTPSNNTPLEPATTFPVLEPKWVPTPFKDPFSLSFLHAP